MAKILHINKRLEAILSKAEIQETLSPGSTTRILPSEKELSRLAYLAGKLCELRRKSCKCATKTIPRSRKKVEIAESLKEDEDHGTILMAGDRPGFFNVSYF